MNSSVHDAYPLTPTQHGMLFNAIQAPNSGVDLEQMVATLRHPLDTVAFERAWTRVMLQHPILHTRYAWEGRDRPVQEVVPELALPFSFTDLGVQPPDDRLPTFDAYLRSDRREGFDFARGPLFRVAVFRLAPAEFRVVLSYSHSIMDGCVSAVLHEVFLAYDAIRAGVDPVFEPRTAYRDHVLWLERHLADTASLAASYFGELLMGFTTPTKLSLERPTTASMQSKSGYGNHVFATSRATSDAIRAASLRHALNPPAFIEAAWALVLGAFSGEDDVVFGFTRECRRSSVPGASDTIGLFINTLPVRADVSSNTLLSTLLARLRDQQKSTRAFEHTPLIDVLAASDVPRGTPLFESIIVYNGYHNNTLMQSWGGDFQKREIDFIDQTSFPLSLMVYADETIHFKLSYDPQRFDESTARRLAAAVTTLLDAMTEDLGVRLSQLTPLSARERTCLLDTWNDTAIDYERTCVHRLFEAQVRRTPERMALAFRDQTLTYAQLNARSNALARMLQAEGAGPGVMVGLFAERGVEMMIALLGILKAGSAYVPLDPAYPRERLAMMIEDTRAPIVVTVPALVELLPAHRAAVVTVSLTELERVSARDIDDIASAVGPDDLAYVIFTSGSTGRPKGVMIEHGNVTNFFAGMDARIGADKPGVWLALTSISFDISVLELFWTLSRGFSVVLQESLNELSFGQKTVASGVNAKPMDFSLFYFASDSGKAGKAQYRLLVEGAKFADTHEFAAVWTPERHFHAFGGLFPNPSVTSAAIAMVTERIQLRAGSVVLPLHNPIRCAEEWSVVDNLSDGRVGLSFASGWHASDFALCPENFQKRRELMWQGIETIRALFRGETVLAKTGDGHEQRVRIYPPSVQKNPPIWITAGGSPETFVLAGQMGANVLTNLLVMSADDLARNIQAYRAAYAAAGHVGDGHVTLMLHTFVGHDLEAVRTVVRGPFMEYLRTSTDLINKARWETTAFAQGDKQSTGAGAGGLDLNDLPADEMEAMMAHAFDRYFKTTGLFGTPSSCLDMVNRLRRMGVSEIACLVDFGVEEEAVLASLDQLDALRKLSNGSDAGAPEDYGIAAQMLRHGVTHMQCTPSLAAMLATDPSSLAALGTLETLMLGGEALPTTLLNRLAPVLRGQLLNMYGPTETTIWSTTALVDTSEGKVTLGRPIANTEVYVVDHAMRLCPIGVPGELLIGGAGVARGYLERPELTAERFVTNPFVRTRPSQASRLYRTGDLARFLPDGQLEFLGRLDHQVKIRGHRIELGEVEALLSRHPSVSECVVVAQPPSIVGGDSRLVGYVIPSTPEATAEEGQNDDAIHAWQNVWNQTYEGGTSTARDATFDISGWKSSYTGELMAESEMREWLEHTVARILALSPTRVLEIGCGTGMLLYRIAPRTESYTGLDFSAAALASIAIEREERGLVQVELRQKRADQMHELVTGAYDTIVLNSVCQYFPDVAYFVNVVEDALALLSPGGALFVGDVRSLPLQEAFHTAVELGRATDETSCEALRARVARKIAEERELVLAPALFDALRAHIPTIASVSVQLKPGQALNELTRFRYDVVIRKTKHRPPDAVHASTSSTQVSSLADMRTAFLRADDVLYLREQPNRRLTRELHAVELLRTLPQDTSVAHVRTAIAALPEDADPSAAYGLFAGQETHETQVVWASSGAPGRFDVVLAPRGAVLNTAPIASAGTAWEAYANRPVRARAGEALPPELRAYLQRHLPEFMLPSAFVVLDAFPLTPNGKIDRKALPSPDRVDRSSSEAYIAPSSDLELKIARVWQRLLNLDHVGVRDNFFELGANSFLMVQASSLLKDELAAPVSLVDLFQYPSIRLLSARIGEREREGVGPSAHAGKERAQTRRDAMQKRRDARTRVR